MDEDAVRTAARSGADTAIADRGRPRSPWGELDWSDPFTRLAITHFLSVVGETMVVLSLASSFFFNIDPSRGREKVILGLLFTMAPFAVVGPFIGPFIDKVRGGHRMVIRTTLFIRAAVAALMVVAVLGDSPALFVEAFAMLVLAKTYQIARAAVVPTTVAGEAKHVEANSKLQLLSSIASTVGGVIGGGCLLIGEGFLLGVTSAVFVAGGVVALRLKPSAAGAEEETSAVERTEVTTPAMLSVAAFGMGLIRLVVGFVTFLMAFELRGGGRVSLGDRAANLALEAAREFDPRVTVPPLGDGPPMWYFGAVLVASVTGGLVGAMIAPRLRSGLDEERIQIGGSLVAVLAGVGAAALSWGGDGNLAGYVALAFGTALAAALAKQAFDSTVQRVVAELDRGQVFARYESRFQVGWVFGALIPAVLVVPIGVGAIVAAAIAAVAAASLKLGVRPAWRSSSDGGRRVGVYASKSGKSGTSNDSSSAGNS
ncbi:MAG: hypothetical protein M9952_16105 [Microthrixaceae bacterium]|nr:hypothetical protein [Microthrixaceae bacterium]